ncbi:MAG: hypothetical protein ACRCVZ_08495 [Aestuariivirga sp.]|jgi:hypothetical protein
MTPDQEESRRILERMEREREKLFHATPTADNDDDQIERLGKRIARILGPLIAVGLMAYLFLTYLG